MSDSPIFDKLAGAKETPVFDSMTGKIDVTPAPAPMPDIPADKIPPIARTIGYVIAAIYAILSVPALSLPVLLWPEYAGQSAIIWATIGGMVTAYTGLVGVMYRPTRTV